MPLPESLINEALERVEQLGGHIGDHAYNNIQAWLPLDTINELAEWEEIDSIRKPIVPAINGITSEGNNIIGANKWHDAGIKGKGINIGVLDMGFKGYSALLGKELPGSVMTKVHGTTDIFLCVEHGTACAEIVHDVSPEANLYLTNVNDVDVDFHNAVNWLTSNGVNVISSSIGLNGKLYCAYLYAALNYYQITNYIVNQMNYFNQMMQQWNNTINNAISGGVTWSQSAGNDGEKKWVGMYSDNDNDYFNNFAPYANYNEIVLNYNFSFGEEVYVAMLWDLDNWGACYHDYDLYVINQYGYTVASSIITQAIAPVGIECVKFYPIPGYRYFIKAFNFNAGFRELSITVGCNDLPSLFYINPIRTVMLTCPAYNPNLITVGAVPYNNPSVIEPFSSQGPTIDGRVKPDLVAPDAVSTVSYANSFYGTSAAAPHVAGVCALVKQRHPTWTPAQIKAFLEANALDLGTPGKDNVFGSGLVRLPAIGSFGIIYPNGGEVLAKGSNYQVQWDPTGGGTDVAIALYKGGGYVGAIAGKTANTGSLSWKIPASLANGSDYLIKIRSFSNASVYDFSDGYFTIQGPTFGILSPNGGEAWEKGQKINIDWNTGNLGGDVAIALYKAGAYITVISGLTANDGHFEWVVPPGIQNGDDYKIKIRSYISNAIIDFSDSNFSITGTTLRVLSPNGGETLYRGGTHTITWAPANGGTDVAIALYKSGGYGCVISGKTANDGSFSWTIPPSLPVGSDYKIKIRDFTNFTIYDFSDFSFTIM